jgi:hypothetical protein
MINPQPAGRPAGLTLADLEMFGRFGIGAGLLVRAGIERVDDPRRVRGMA